MTSVKVFVIGLKVLRMTLIGPGDGVSIMISFRYIFIFMKETRTYHREIKYGDNVSVARISVQKIRPRSFATFNLDKLGRIRQLPYKERL